MFIQGKNKEQKDLRNAFQKGIVDKKGQKMYPGHQQNHVRTNSIMKTRRGRG